MPDSGEVMLNYRLYLMDNCGRHIDDVVVIQAASEAEAIQAAGETAPNSVRELWNMQRLVGCFPKMSRHGEMLAAA